MKELIIQIKALHSIGQCRMDLQTFSLTCWLNFLLLLLSHFSRVRLCANPETAAYQAPLSLGFSRQERWSGLAFPSPMRESEVSQSCLTLRDPTDCSLPGSSIHGICQARILDGVSSPSLFYRTLAIKKKIRQQLISCTQSPT